MGRNACLALAAAALILCGSLASAQEPEFVPLFDGKSLEGWEGNAQMFRVAEGAIVAGSLTERIARNEFLASTKEYGDFELRLKARLTGQGQNAGVQFRSQRIPDHHEMIGYQCDMGTMQNRPIWGALYDESRRRKFLAEPAAEKLGGVLKAGDWNELTIRCEGPRIQLWVNGLPTVDYTETDADIPRRGKLGLQIHGGPPAEAAYKDIRIRELPAKVGAWKLDELQQTPAMRWLSQSGPVHSLLYRGEKYQGQDTEVFAFYASPATLKQASPQETFPGVVLIHGGGGTAFAEWAFLWAKRGYAAIAMDLAGCRPIDPIYDSDGAPLLGQAAKPESRTRLPNGGPNQGHPEKFDTIGGDFSDDWPYHAAASVIRAHSLLRSFPEVLAERTAVTGISWGGYTTCLVASLDDRFRAAVPVYGCGYLFEGESVQRPAIDKLGERRDEWIKTYDPSSLLPRCRVPILFVNGTNDIHYTLDSYQKSFNVVPGHKQMRIEVNMRHGHPPGWAPQEIGLFIDSHCRGGQPLCAPGQPKLVGDLIHTPYTSTVPLQSAALHYTSDAGLRSSRKWHTLPAEVTAAAAVSPKPPAEANTWFVTLTDTRGAMVSTSVQFGSADKPQSP